MLLPEPKSGESQGDYISRCMDVMSGDDKPEDQKLAICYSKYRKARGANIEKSELFAELMFEKSRVARIIERLTSAEE